MTARLTAIGARLGMHRNARQNAKLRARIEAVDIGRWVRFRIAKLLRIGQNGGVVSARLHATQNVVTRPVDDAAESCHLVAAKPLQHARNHRNTACDRGSMH